MVPLELDDYLRPQWEQTRIAFVSGPLGFGKSAFARRMLRGLDVLEVDAEREDAAKAVTEATAREHEAVLLDNIHDAISAAQGSELAAVAERCPGTRFVFVSRAPMPGWLTPFFARGEVLIVTSEDLSFTNADIAHLLAANGVSPDPARVRHLAELTMRYPLAVALAVSHILQDHGNDWESSIYDEVMRYFEVEFDRRFDAGTQAMLLLATLFGRVDDDFVTSVLGEKDGRAFLETIHHNTCFITREGRGWTVRPDILTFFRWERERRHADGDAQAIVSRAIDYYVERGNYPSALEVCSRSGDRWRMLRILEEHARLHPGNGSYFELERYYHALPDAVVRSSPRLMRIMSLLDSMSMDTMGSERWYAELERYEADPANDADSRRRARAYLAYLDLALPHRRLDSLLDAVSALARLGASRDPDLALSLTSGMPSIINGGRDLSPWVPDDERTCRMLGRVAGRALGRTSVGCLEVALCESRFEKGEDALPYLARMNAALPKVRRDGDRSVEFAAVGMQCRNLVDLGDARQALAILDRYRRPLAWEDDPQSRRIVLNLDAMRCRCWLHLGESALAHAWLEENAPSDLNSLWYLDRYVYLTCCQAYVAESRHDEAMRLMSTLGEYVESRDRYIEVIHYNTLAAIVSWRTGGGDWAVPLGRALANARRFGYVRTITQYGAAVLPLLLEAQDRDPASGEESAQLARLVKGARAQASRYPDFLAQPKGPAERLTEAECEVLRLICQDKSNAEIGQVLGIKLPTVKTHVSHILAKLGVRRRSQAATEARRLHLV
ncbi:MAG: LuxR C-terminal-related transcriptional regulator [Parafannyhessea sp.]|uniref:LuxR C-terminal-related transcriptional regulator n=1 Tax=Parafannyhessea sp. TaxID=2847324 RepID=UPI003EFFBFF5